MNELTEFQWVYILELTAPTFYQVTSNRLKSEEDRKEFYHFEESEKKHAPMIKDFLANYGREVFYWPWLIEIFALVSWYFIYLFGEKAIWLFGYITERKAVQVYTKLANSTKDEKFRQINLQLQSDEIPHLEFFTKKLGKNGRKEL